MKNNEIRRLLNEKNESGLIAELKKGLSYEETQYCIQVGQWEAMSPAAKTAVVEEMLKQAIGTDCPTVPISFKPKKSPNELGGYEPSNKEIVLNDELLKPEKKFLLVNVLNHEAYHAVQHEVAIHPNGKAAQSIDADTAEKWRENAFVYYSYTDYPLGRLYGSQAQERHAFEIGNQRMKKFFDDPQFDSDKTKYNYATVERECIDDFQNKKKVARGLLGDQFERKTDLKIRADYLMKEERRLFTEVNALVNPNPNPNPELKRQAAELRTAINRSCASYMPLSVLAGMSETELQAKEKELEELVQRGETFQKNWGVNLFPQIVRADAAMHQEEPTFCTQTREQIQRTLDGRRLEIDQEVLALNALQREMGGPPRERGALLAEAASQYLGGEDKRLAMEKGALLLERETLDKERCAAERYGEQTGFATAVARHLPSWCQSAEMREYQAELQRLTEKEQQLAQRETKINDKQHSLEVRLQQPEAQQGVEKILDELQQKEAERGATLEPLLARKAELDAERKDIVALSCTYRSSEKATELQIQGDPLDAKNLASQSAQIIAQMQVGGAEQNLALARA